MHTNRDIDGYREKVMGCWLGKAVGGTLGQTFEGNLGLLDATFYHPVPEHMVPNDDLDLQVVHALTLAGMDAPVVDRDRLAEGWRRHVQFPWNEYGVGLRNLKEGLVPPQTGAYDNWFTCGEGAAIRSELWACLAPGDPHLAAQFAYEDACFDHAGDGVHAPMFLAALAAQAFEDDDIERMLDRAQGEIPEDCLLASAIADTRAWGRDSALTWQDVRELIVDRYGNDDFTDVRVNTAFVLLGLLRGATFEERILITNNCGYDTDSSTASLGALLGILDPSGIPQTWLDPIGRALVLNDDIVDLEPPATLDAFADLVVTLRERVTLHGRREEVAPVDITDLGIDVKRSFFNLQREVNRQRDLPGLPPEGAPEPDIPREPVRLPGSWVRMHRDEFADELMLLEYAVRIPEAQDVRVMFNCTEPWRMWIDGTYVHAAQGSMYMFPAPHMPPVGQYWDGSLDAGEHRLVVVLHQPARHARYPHEWAEWVIAVTHRPSYQHIPFALRSR